MFLLVLRIDKDIIKTDYIKVVYCQGQLAIAYIHKTKDKEVRSPGTKQEYICRVQVLILFRNNPNA